MTYAIQEKQLQQIQNTWPLELQALIRVANGGTVEATCKELGLSLRRYYLWQKALSCQGIILRRR